MNKIYISSSWKNSEAVRILATCLKSNGYEVYDFTDPRCRKTPEIPPEKFPVQFDPSDHHYGTYLNRPEWRDAVMENKEALEWCDVVLLLLPCGIDATADWAYGLGLGKKYVVIGHPRAGERSPVHLWADVMVDYFSEAFDWLETLKAREQER